MEDIKHLLGQNIKKLRIKKGFSQQELAELVNIDQRNMSNIECGNNFPTKTLMKLANVLDVSLPELFDFNYLKLSEASIKQEIIEKLDKLSLKELQIIYRLIKIM